MLDLQRASAGSGKTYTLAKKYIWYLLTIKPEGSSTRRLRTDAELADSSRHILAITFTNKATNEMQTRIVEKLHALSIPPTEKKLPDYLEEYVVNLLGSGRPLTKTILPEEKEMAEKVREAAEKATALLLENYSDFNVSTIDSFFQSVLRTFAYETDISDSYQVELDSEFLSQVGIDATLEEIDNKSSDTHTPFWVRTLIAREKGSNWNIFQRKISEGFGQSPYEAFIKSVGRLENEEYKEVRGDVEHYLKSHPDLPRLLTDLTRRYEPPVKKAYEQMQAECRKLWHTLNEQLRSASGQSHVGMFARACKTAGIPRPIATTFAWNKVPASTSAFNLSDEMMERPKVVEALGATPESHKIREAARAAQKAFENWLTKVSEPEFQNWMLYAANLPYLALFDIVTRKRGEYLSENNLVELGETAMLLQGVIGDSDTPFIYERLGTYLNHFLIDEFQDTSKLQWKILSPLLHESMSRNNDNLIIGDAKQSIYRFRNADPSLISNVVPDEFSGRVNIKGELPADNTNYRSCRYVVEFNNRVFRHIVDRLDSQALPGRRLFAGLYSNVEQLSNATKPEGYAEVRTVKSGDKLSERLQQEVPQIITDLMARGYRQRDIAVLTDTNNNAEKIIDILRNYNNSRPTSAPEIRYISEQSLKVASSRAVKIVLGVLENVARGRLPNIRQGEERRKYGAGNWRELASNFKFFSMTRPADEPTAERLDAFLNNGADFDAISDLLNRMPATALPALVEASVAEFVNEDLQKSDALFLAAFQDIVTEYCEGHPSDVASFLKWWERKSRTAAVTSPEDTEAVRVLTIHKSKGLEYECVIVPHADWNFKDAAPSSLKKEWRWVKPMLVSHPDIELPPYMPVDVCADMAFTSHSELLNQYYDLKKMDDLNSAYVALTRAKRELYLFTPVATEKKKAAGTSLNTGNMLLDLLGPGTTLTAGEKPEKAPALDLSKDKPSIPLSGYESAVSPAPMKFRLDTAMLNMEESETEGKLDVRAEGNVKHAVLERVVRREDLPLAVRQLLLEGMLSPTMAAKVEAELAKGLALPMAARWFDGRARVITERPVLKKGEISRRPDRVMIFDDGHAEVVDYKFGAEDHSGKYAKQVGDYINLLRATGKFTHVTGYIWYVKLGKVTLV